jgi:hypothetical protein
MVRELGETVDWPRRHLVLARDFSGRALAGATAAAISSNPNPLLTKVRAVSMALPRRATAARCYAEIFAPEASGT